MSIAALPCGCLNSCLGECKEESNMPNTPKPTAVPVRITGKPSAIKTWQESNGRWHIDWQQGPNNWSTGGGMGFATEKEAKDWLTKP